MAKRPVKKKNTKETERKKEEDWAMEIIQTRSDIKSFLEKFKAEVAGKTKKYQDYARESQKKKKL